MRERVKALIGVCLITFGLIAMWPIIKKHQSPIVKTVPSKEEPEEPQPKAEELNQATFLERFNGTFPNIYLTIVSIIQGVAVYTLTSQTYFYIVKFNKDLSWLQFVPFSLASFLLIVVIAYEYTWFVALFRWPPKLLDIVIPLGLGGGETLPMYYFTDYLGYCLTTAFLCLTGAFAYWYSWRNFPNVKIAKEFKKVIHHYLNRYFLINITFALVCGAMLLMLFVFLSQNFIHVRLLYVRFFDFGLIPISNILKEPMVWVPFLTLEVFILCHAPWMLKKLTQAFKIPTGKPPLKRWLPGFHQSRLQPRT